MKQILDEKWINALPDKVVNNLQNLNNDVIKVICERINSTGKLIKTDTIRLSNIIQYSGADLKQIEKIIEECTQKNKREIKQLLEKVASVNDNFAKSYYEYRGLSAITHTNDTYLNDLYVSIIKETQSTFENLSNTFAFKFPDKRYLPLRDAYTRIIDKAIYEVNSGTLDYNTAMRQTVKNLSASGIRVANWNSGVHRRIDTAARMNIIDGVRRLNQDMMLYHGEQFGSDGIELSAHAISAPDHMWVQGHQFSNEEFDKMQSGESCKDVNGREYEAFERPIGEWNCKHFAVPIVIGISTPAYTEEQLSDMRQNSKKKYDINQQMRKMETDLRTLKDRRIAFSSAGNSLDAQRCQREINAKQKAYRVFCDKNGLSQQIQRTQVDGYKKISTEGLPKDDTNDIINKYKGKGIKVSSDTKISTETVNKVEAATKNVTSDFKTLEKCSEPIIFGDADNALAINQYNPNTGLNQIILSKSDFADTNALLQKLKDDFASGKSYDTGYIESLIAHEMGHNAHNVLALKRAGVEYGRPLSRIEQALFKAEHDKISQEIYITAFSNEKYDKISTICNNSLGTMVDKNPDELVAQSFGNYYYGNKKSKIAKSIVKYFMKGLK